MQLMQWNKDCEFQFHAKIIQKLFVPEMENISFSVRLSCKDQISALFAFVCFSAKRDNESWTFVQSDKIMQLQKILPNSQTSMLHRVNQMVEQRVGLVGTSLKNISMTNKNILRFTMEIRFVSVIEVPFR